MRKFWPFFALVLAWSPASQAMELDYYTYNAFDETVSAFKRLALLFSDVSFLAFVLIFAVLGVLIGALMIATKGVSGGQVSPIGWLFPVLFGVVLFKGAVLPTGRLDVFDPVRNAFIAVDGVPDLVIVLAGVLNKIERGVVEMVDTAGGSAYADDAGSIDFSLVNSAMGIPITDVNLDRSLSQYYTDCGTLALATNANGVTKQEFLRNTDDLFSTFAKFVNPAVYTVYYPPGIDSGQTMTCTDAWNALSPLLQNASTFQDMRNALCKVAGFDPTQPAQVTRCEAELGNTSNLYGVGAASSLVFLRSVALAKSVSEAMNSADFSLQQRMLVDRQIMAEGFGVAQAANQWIPKLRGFITAAVLGVVPLTLLFVGTPLVFRALALMCGLFTWLTLWGITDALAVTMAHDAAVTAFNDIQNFHFGYDAILNTPDAAMQALGVVGKARTMALGLATIISGALFQFASYELSMMAGSMQSQVDHSGAQAGTQTLLPEQRSSLVEGLLHSTGATAELANAGFTTAAAGRAMAGLRGIGATEGYVNRSLSQGIRPALGAVAEGEMEGGARVGALEGSLDAAAARQDASLGEVSRQQQRGRTARDFGSGFGELDQAGGAPALLDVARTQGQSHVAETQVAREIYRNVNHTAEESPEGWRNVQRQLQGTAIAISEIGNTEAYIEAQRQLQLASNAAGAVAAARPGSAEMVGSMRQLQETLHSQAFGDALKVVGEASATRGMEFPIIQSAETGQAAQEAGGLGAVATETARVQVADQLSHARLTERLAHSLGEDSGSMRGLVEFSQERDSAQVSLAVTPANRDQVISRLKGVGLMSDFAEDELRRGRGGQVSFAFDTHTGEPVSMRLQAGGSSVFSTTDHAEQGRALSTFWTQSLDVSESVLGGANLLEVENLQKGYLAAYASLATGAHDAQTGGRWASWTAGLGDGLQQLGFRADATSALVKGWRFGVDGALGGGGELGVATAKLGGSGGWHRDSSDQSVTTENLNLTTSQHIVDSSLHRSIAEYERVHGAGSASHASDVLLAHRAAEIAHEEFGELLKADTHATDAARQNNSALNDAGQLPPGIFKEVGDTFSGMQDAMEKAREKLGPGYVR